LPLIETKPGAPDHAAPLQNWSLPPAFAEIRRLLEARDEKRLLKLQAQLRNVKLLIVDELGYVPLSQVGAELLFKVFSQRYERGSITAPGAQSP
jgi:DNA replication protein DnaC